MSIDDYAPRGFIRFSIITCSDCSEKYITTEGTDNAYDCNNCRRDLMTEQQIQYDISEKELIDFLEKNYKGVNAGSRS
jgi:hypothetical protein